MGKLSVIYFAPQDPMIQEPIILHDYPRSSAAYRVRIALNLKSLPYRSLVHDLREGAQQSATYREINPQALVPALQIGPLVIRQSLAIIDYLDSRSPTPRLIPVEPTSRARALEIALMIACDIHPLNNLRVLNYLKQTLHLDDDASATWYRHWITEGFAAIEALAPLKDFFGGAAPNISDICLAPQMFNARRFGVPLDPYPKLVAIDAQMAALPAVAAAHPEQQGRS